MRGVTCQGEDPPQVKLTMHGEVVQSKLTLQRRTNHLRSVSEQREDPLLGIFTPQGLFHLEGQDALKKRDAQLKGVPQQLEYPLLVKVTPSKTAL